VLTAGEFDLAVLGLDADDGAAMLRFASRLRAEGVTRDLPVLLIGDAAQRGLLLRGFELGASDHVLRPVDPNELRARVRNQIRRKRYQERLQTGIDRSLELAVTDPLTGLRNRRYVHRHLGSVLRQQDAAVVLVDIDRFKQINDTHGHAAGDAALRLVAERLRQHLRAADLIARYGGEEFIVVLAGAPAEYAAAVAERLRASLAQEPIRVERITLDITVSIGLARVPAGTTVDQAISAADAALYRAKAGGRNRVETASEGDAALSAAREAAGPIT
jgi:two-component system cell cycle response regulator